MKERQLRILAGFIGLVNLLSVSRADVPPESSFDIRVNIEDQHEVHLAVTVPNGTAHRLQIEGDLSLKLQVSDLLSWGGLWVDAYMSRNSDGTDMDLTLMDFPIRPDEPAHVQWLAFSICGERVIAVRDAAPGRCADLQPIAEPDRLYGRCGVAGNNCIGPYEGMPEHITSHERIAPASEPGEPLNISGRVLDADGRPRPGIIVYGYQTDQNGAYPPVYPPRSSASNYHGMLRGWVRSDARGNYTFDTIRPGEYGGNPEHVHMHVIEPGCATYIIDDLMFADDANLLRLTPEQRGQVTPGRGGSGVSVLRRAGNGWAANRDIHLGENVPDYEDCEAL